MIVAGGGTGGHLFPGMAVAECLTSGGDGCVLFVGSTFGIEARVIPRTRFGFRALPIRGLRGRGWKGAWQLGVQLPVALWSAWRAVRNFDADVVLGVGGYASFPVVLAAWLSRVPAVLLEPNATPGLANRVLARVARRVCTAFAEGEKRFPAGKVVCTGNPVRALAVPRAATTSGFTLLVFGGSQGARRINEAACAAAPRLRESVAGFSVIHQTGAADRDRVRDRYAAAGVPAEVLPFIDDMGAAYARADLVLCRAGATTLAELAMLGKAAILVPYPHAADDHQTANAKAVVARGAALMVSDADLSGDRLCEMLPSLVRDRRRLAAMAEAALALGIPDAAQRVLRVCREVVGEAGGGA